VAAGIVPLLVKEVVEELQAEERETREKLRKLDREGSGPSPGFHPPPP
jgi:hypothetical protein